jgi:hypothetical protein
MSLLFAAALSGQQPARVQLVRCTAGSDAPCLRTVALLAWAGRAVTSQVDLTVERTAWTGSIAGEVLVPTGTIPVGRDFIFGISGGGVANLARATAVGSITIRLSRDTVARNAIDWRPPLIAMPAFQGVADSAMLSPAFREAMVVGMPGGGDRPMIAVLLLTVVGCGWVLLARLGWSEPVIPPRERLPGSPPTFVAPPPPAAEPRRPEEITNQTARHTALRR